MNSKPTRKTKTMKSATINPEAMIKAFAKTYGIPAKDVFLQVFITGNDLYNNKGDEACCKDDWLVDEGILTGSKNQIEIVPQYWERRDNAERVETFRREIERARNEA